MIYYCFVCKFSLLFISIHNLISIFSMYTTNSDFIFNVNPNFIHRFWLLSGPIFNMNNNPVTLLHNYMNLKYPCLQYDNLKQFPFNLGTMLLVVYNLMYFYHQFVHEIQYTGHVHQNMYNGRGSWADTVVYRCNSVSSSFAHHYPGSTTTVRRPALLTVEVIPDQSRR